jgi:hypothetical protein
METFSLDGDEFAFKVVEMLAGQIEENYGSKNYER